MLEDGNTVAPSEVAPDESGALRHTSGVAVAMRGQVPRSRGVYPDQERAKAAEADQAKATPTKTKARRADREIRPDNRGPTYLTRNSEE